MVDNSKTEAFSYPNQVALSQPRDIDLNSSLFQLNENSCTEFSADFRAEFDEADQHIRSSIQEIENLTRSLEIEEASSPLDLSEELGIDVEEQRRLLEQFEEQKRLSERSDTLENNIHEANEDSGSCGSHGSSIEMIDIAPGVQLPLRSSTETWQAILNGNTIETQCCCCMKKLICIDDAEFLACADCWVFSPIDIDYSGSFNANGVCIGVCPEVIESCLLR